MLVLMVMKELLAPQIPQSAVQLVDHVRTMVREDIIVLEEMYVTRITLHPLSRTSAHIQMSLPLNLHHTHIAMNVLKIANVENQQKSETDKLTVVPELAE